MILNYHLFIFLDFEPAKKAKVAEDGITKTSVCLWHLPQVIQFGHILIRTCGVAPFQKRAKKLSENTSKPG